MAGLALKVGAVSSNPQHYQDGDILAAFNRRRIRCVHAQHICHVKNAGGGVGVHRILGHVSQDFFEKTLQYRFERVNRNQVRRVTLSTLDEVIIDSMPSLIDGKMQHMEVDEYIVRRLTHARHRIFGTTGGEVWYGGRTDVSHTSLDLVWEAIEAKTPHLETSFTEWPAGSQDLKSHLFVKIDEFTEDESSELVGGEFDNTDPTKSVLLRKRKRFIDWRDAFPVNFRADIDNKNIPFDGRSIPPGLQRLIHVQTKSDL